MKILILTLSLLFTFSAFAEDCSPLVKAKVKLYEHLLMNNSKTIRSDVDGLKSINKLESSSWLGLKCWYSEDVNNSSDDGCDYTDSDYVMEYQSTPWEDCWIGISKTCKVDRFCLQTDL